MILTKADLIDQVVQAANQIFPKQKPVELLRLFCIFSKKALKQVKQTDIDHGKKPHDADGVEAGPRFSKKIFINCFFVRCFKRSLPERPAYFGKQLGWQSFYKFCEPDKKL